MPDWNEDTATPQKYFFDGTHAYTEDFVLVYNLAINEPSEGVNTNFVREYTVKNYGKVNDCCVLTYQCFHLLTDGFICFVDPKDAALMLRKFHHEHEGQNFVVGPLFSWQQPNPHLAVHRLHNANSDGETNEHHQSGREEAPRINVDASPYSSQFDLFKVNDDCLELILDFLPLVDKIQFARTCKRFLEVFQNKMSYKYRTLCASDLEDLTIWQKRDFMNFCGKFAENLTLSSDCVFFAGRWLDTVVTGCPNLLALTVKNVDARNICFNKLWHMDSEIRELTFEDSWIDNCLQGIDRLIHLEILSLNDSSLVTGGVDLNEVSSRLKKLYLRNFQIIRPKMFISALKKMTKLIVLDVRCCYWLTKKVFEEISVNCHNLEKLGIHFSSGDDCGSVVNLPCLKELLLESTSKESFSGFPAFLNNFVKSHSENLEMLRIDGRRIVSIPLEAAEIIGNFRNLKKLYFHKVCNLSDAHILAFKKLLNLEGLRLNFCTTFSIDGLLNLLMSCTKLKYLNIDGCSQITKDEILKIIVLLKRQFQAEQRKQKLHLMLPGSSNDNDIDTENYLSTCDYKSVLKIIHKSEADYYGDCFHQSEDIPSVHFATDDSEL